MKVFVAVLFCLVGLGWAQDPCTSYADLAAKERNSKYVLNKLTSAAICDELLPQDWYRFSGDAGEYMAEGKVETNKCGTSAPIYLEAKHPSKGDYAERDLKVCANFGLTGNGCEWSDTIKVKRCQNPGGDYFVYLLKAPPACDMAYCGFSNKFVPCPVGQSPDETKTTCIVATPAITAPNMGTPIVTGDDFYIPCNLNVKNQADKDKGMVNVAFMFNGQIGYTINGVSLKDAHAKLPGRELKGKLPSKVSCAVVGFWRHNAGSNVHRTKTLLSTNSFFAGIRVFDEKGAEVKGEIIFGEDDSKPQRLKIVSTIPITKNTHDPLLANEPTLDFGLHTYVSGAKLFNLKQGAHRCSSQIMRSGWDNKKGEAGATSELQFVAYQDLTIGGGKKATDIQLEMKKQLTKFSIWDGFKVPPIKVRVKQASPAQCSSYPDPHFKSFDGRKFDVHALGEFKLAEVPGLFTATVRHQPCRNNPRPACNCALSIRELDEVILIDMCGKSRPQIIYRNAKDPTAVAPTRLSMWGDNSGKNFEVTTNSGFKAKVSVHKTMGLSVNIMSPEGFRNELVGLCGNMNGNLMDDFFGKSHAAFYESFRVTNPTDSPFRVTQKMAEMKNKRVSGKENYCFCYEKVIRCDQTPTRNPRNLRLTKSISPRLAGIFGLGRGRGKRSATKPPYTDDVEVYTDTFDLNPPQRDLGPIRFPTPSGITEARARVQCEAAIRNSSISSKCALLPKFDIMMTLQDCLFDIKITDSLSVAAVSTGAMEDACENEAFMIAPEDAAKLTFKPEEIAQEKCPQACSLHGVCSKGVCTCHPGYLGADCSINANAVPEIEDFLDGGVCDVAERPCRKIRLGVTNVYDTPKLTCRHRIFNVDPVTGAETENHSVVVKAVMESFEVVSCFGAPLLGRSMVLMTSVSTNGRDFSKPQRYVVHDSTCVDCSSGKCLLERDMCVIRGHVESTCYAAGDINPINPREVCTPAASRTNWSLVATTTPKPTQPPTFKCSSQPISNKVSPLKAVSVATGNVATAASWPWHAEVKAGGQHACSGVLVHQQWVLTSEACVAKSKGSYLTVRMGGETYGVTNWVDSGDGLTLMRLTVKASVSAICLGKSAGEFDGATSEECYTTGFVSAAESCYDAASSGAGYRGFASATVTAKHCFNWASSNSYQVRPQQYGSQGISFHNHCRNPMTDDNLRLSTKPWCYVDTQGTKEDCKVTPCNPAIAGTLQQARVSVQDKTKCNEFYGGSLTANQNCAGFSGTEIFQGETGGPLVCRRSSSSPFRLLGVRSPITADWSDGTTPAFQNVGASLAWITRTTGV